MDGWMGACVVALPWLSEPFPSRMIGRGSLNTICVLLDEVDIG